MAPALRRCVVAAAGGAILGLLPPLGCAKAEEESELTKTPWASLEETKRYAEQLGLGTAQMEEMMKTLQAEAGTPAEESGSQPPADYFKDLRSIPIEEAAVLSQAILQALSTEKAKRRIEKVLRRLEGSPTSAERISALGPTVRSLTSEVADRHGFSKSGFMDAMRAVTVAIGRAAEMSPRPHGYIDLRQKFEQINTILTGDVDQRRLGRLQELDSIVARFTGLNSKERDQAALKAMHVIKRLSAEGVSEVSVYAEALHHLLEEGDSWLIAEILQVRAKLTAQEHGAGQPGQDRILLGRLNVLSVFTSDSVRGRVTEQLPAAETAGASAARQASGALGKQSSEL